jgi:hypothetical protein
MAQAEAEYWALHSFFTSNLEIYEKETVRLENELAEAKARCRVLKKALGLADKFFGQIWVRGAEEQKQFEEIMEVFGK